MRVLNLRDSRSLSRTLGLGLAFAIAGFCFALANSTQVGESQNAVESRAVGSFITLRFTNPQVTTPAGVPLAPTEYDLGDACFGSVITRYVTAEGGLRPYRFVSTGTSSLANITANTGSTLVLGVSGGITGRTPDVPPGLVGSIPGVVPAFLQANGPSGKQPGLRFPVTVSDSTGTNIIPLTGNFNLFLFNSTFAGFRFAIDSLPPARLGSSYSGRVDVLNGKAPVKLSALSVTNAATGAVTTLQNLGLFFGSDGTLIGRPLAVGTYIINTRATDAANFIAKSRKNPAVFDQALTLVIADNPVTSSDLFTTSCSVKGTLSTFGADSLKYKGIINNLGNDQLSLSGSAFSFSLGGFSFSGKLDKHGSYKSKLVDKSTFSFKVNPRSGRVDVAISKAAFTSALNLTDLKSGTMLLPLQINLGDAVVGSEVLQFISLVDGTGYTLNYSLGRTGQSASGGFQIVSVRGKDDIAFNGQPGDSWQVGFMAQPRTGVTNPQGLREGFDNITSINVRIGTNFAQRITGGGIIGAGPGIKFQGGPVDGLKSFNLDTISGKGSIKTRTLAAAATSIPQASKSLSTNNIFFPLGVDINRLSTDQTFVGEHARRIFNYAKNYSDAPPRGL